MNPEGPQPEARPVQPLETLWALFFDAQGRRVGKTLVRESRRPLGLAITAWIAREARSARASAIEVVRSAAEGRVGPLEISAAETKALYRMAFGGLGSGIERLTLRRVAADGRWVELIARRGENPALVGRWPPSLPPPLPPEPEPADLGLEPDEQEQALDGGR